MFDWTQLNRSPHEPGHAVLVELVSFFFDTIVLGSVIVCELPALPHDLVPNQTQD